MHTLRKDPFPRMPSTAPCRGLPGECNYSIDRGELNAFWLQAAEEAGARLCAASAGTDRWQGQGTREVRWCECRV